MGLSDSGDHRREGGLNISSPFSEVHILIKYDCIDPLVTILSITGHLRSQKMCTKNDFATFMNNVDTQ